MSRLVLKLDGTRCHVTHYIYLSLVYLSVTLRYSGLFGLVCNSPVQGQVVTLGFGRAESEHPSVPQGGDGIPHISQITCPVALNR
jgi:hypothetical protein